MTGPELCPKCKGLHYRTSPCVVRVTTSTERKNMAVASAVAPVARLGFEDNASDAKLAVDTILYAGAPPRGRGRPRTITDMKAYKAAKAREYRAKAKNAND